MVADGALQRQLAVTGGLKTLPWHASVWSGLGLFKTLQTSGNKAQHAARTFSWEQFKETVE